MPYKGSKNSIAAEIISILPPAKHFYDIFANIVLVLPYTNKNLPWVFTCSQS